MNAKKSTLIFWSPIILMIVVNVAYNIVAKVTPTEVNEYASVFLTYSVCFTCSLVFYFVSNKEKKYFKSLKMVNWAAPAMGMSLVLMEVAILLQYRAGWDISVAVLAIYVLLAICLMAVGGIFYKEKITVKKVLGCTICLIGLYLVILF